MTKIYYHNSNNTAINKLNVLISDKNGIFTGKMKGKEFIEYINSEYYNPYRDILHINDISVLLPEKPTNYNNFLFALFDKLANMQLIERAELIKFYYHNFKLDYYTNRYKYSINSYVYDMNNKCYDYAKQYELIE